MGERDFEPDPENWRRACQRRAARIVRYKRKKRRKWVCLAELPTISARKPGSKSKTTTKPKPDVDPDLNDEIPYR